MNWKYLEGICRDIIDLLSCNFPEGKRGRGGGRGGGRVTKIVSHNSPCVYRNSKRKPPKYESRMLPLSQPAQYESSFQDLYNISNVLIIPSSLSQLFSNTLDQYRSHIEQEKQISLKIVAYLFVSVLFHHLTAWSASCSVGNGEMETMPGQQWYSTWANINKIDIIRTCISRFNYSKYIENI